MFLLQSHPSLLSLPASLLTPSLSASLLTPSLLTPSLLIPSLLTTSLLTPPSLSLSFPPSLVMRASGSYRVLLNTHLWAQMKCDRANQKSIRITAQSTEGKISVFLMMVSQCVH